MTGSRRHHRQTQGVPTGADTVMQMVAVQAVLNLHCHDQEYVIRTAQRLPQLLQLDPRPSPSQHCPPPPPPHNNAHQAGCSSTKQGTLTAAALLRGLESQAWGNEEEEGDDDDDDEEEAADAESPHHRSPGSPAHRETPRPHTQLSGHAGDLVTDSHEPQLPPACDREGRPETTVTPPTHPATKSVSTTTSEKAAEDPNQQQAATASTKRKRDAEIPPPSAQRTLAQRVEALRRENARLKALCTCRHCRIRPVNLALLPCGHLCLCVECGPAFSKCPVCLKKVLADVKTFVA
ncbi:uncharacterized protein LOC143290766 [Babylonia areolata]|uniref:uncharacterized protein LOC143290766 n=1 Tax=Babylonia areolata TaxID=304850 RepID=UPI003FD04A54